MYGVTSFNPARAYCPSRKLHFGNGQQYNLQEDLKTLNEGLQGDEKFHAILKFVNRYEVLNDDTEIQFSNEEKESIKEILSPYIKSIPVAGMHIKMFFSKFGIWYPSDNFIGSFGRDIITKGPENGFL